MNLICRKDLCVSTKLSIVPPILVRVRSIRSHRKCKSGFQLWLFHGVCVPQVLPRNMPKFFLCIDITLQHCTLKEQKSIPRTDKKRGEYHVKEHWKTSLAFCKNLKRNLMSAWGEINALLPSGLFQRDIKEREIEYGCCIPEMILEVLNAGSAFQRHCPVKSEYWCCSCPPSLHSLLPHM